MYPNVELRLRSTISVVQSPVFCLQGLLEILETCNIHYVVHVGRVLAETTYALENGLGTRPPWEWNGNILCDSEGFGNKLDFVVPVVTLVVAS